MVWLRRLYDILGGLFCGSGACCMHMCIMIGRSFLLQRFVLTSIYTRPNDGMQDNLQS